MSSRAQIAERKEIALENAIARAKAKSLFDDAVARAWLDGSSYRATAARLGCNPKRVERSRAWQGLSRLPDTETAREALNELSRRSRQFDREVLRGFAAGQTPEEIAAATGCAVLWVLRSMAWLELRTGRNLWRQGVRTGRLSSAGAIDRLAAVLG